MSFQMSGMYKVMLFLHLLSVVAAFAPMIVGPVTMRRAKDDGDGTFLRVAGYLAANGRQIHMPALVLAGLFGLGMVFSSKAGTSDENFWGFDQAWVSLALLVWIAMCGVVSGLIMPGERKVAAGDETAEKRVALGGQIVTVLFLVIMYLMIWKPGA